jgi:DNA repair exonuclease SbcCD ATPase subunit
MSMLTTITSASELSTQVKPLLTVTGVIAQNLTASCQAIMETSLAPSANAWYPQIQQNLLDLQSVAVYWQQHLAKQASDDIQGSLQTCAQAFQRARPSIDQLFVTSETQSHSSYAELHQEFLRLEQAVKLLRSVIETYEDNVRSWGQDLRRAHDVLEQTIQTIQNQATELQDEISVLNSHITNFGSEIIRYRDAINRAQAERTQGIVQTIFGILLAPITFGTSLILAGVGVSSIVEAESNVQGLEQLIREHQQRIIQSQQTINQDQIQLVSLRALLVSATIATSDTEAVLKILDTFRVAWEAFSQELASVIQKIAKAEASEQLLVEKLWWNAVIKQWELSFPLFNTKQTQLRVVRPKVIMILPQ